ncbi:hypothetical protein [Uliginosibacterium gangwonense]|uniref:hypothetical protein n=1 Tax=Uliginosibacterium gangwonense TaxID=392736 RepID=UPI000382388D|nr:hypothetical protein [Uliginosibacterium gangwonense]
MAQDANGRPVLQGTRVRLLSLSGEWFDNLPADEKADVLSMIGEVFEVTEIDEYGYPWVGESWPDAAKGEWRGHSIALESHEMEVVDEVYPALCVANTWSDSDKG